jgi:hypothetical protein
MQLCTVIGRVRQVHATLALFEDVNKCPDFQIRRFCFSRRVCYPSCQKRRRASYEGAEVRATAESYDEPEMCPLCSVLQIGQPPTN